VSDKVLEKHHLAWGAFGRALYATQQGLGLFSQTAWSVLTK